MEKEKWDLLINEVKKQKNTKVITPFIESGHVVAAILTKKGNVYVGVSIDTACTLGICAERNAIHTMIANGESEIDRIVCIDSNDKFILPCGACRELIMQLSVDSKNIKILVSDDYKYTTMEELLPNWWGTDRFEE